MVEHVFLVLRVRDAATRFDVLVDHCDVEVEELRAWVQSLVANDERAEVLSCCLFDPLRGVLSELLKDFD